MRLLTVFFLITISTAARNRPFNVPRTDAFRNHEEDFEKEFGIPASRHVVPFGHIFLEGIEDPYSEQKAPIDLLELNSIYVKASPRIREKLKKYNITYEVLRVPKPGQYRIIRDPVRYDKKKVKQESAKVNDSVTFWDMATIQQRNLFDPPKRRIGVKRKIPQADEGPAYIRQRNDDVRMHDRGNEKQYYNLKADNFSIDILPELKANEYNFTTCDEFGRNAKFHPNDIINIDWVPFYIWTYELDGRNTEARVHKFTYPTKKLVVKYKTELGPFINKTINWEQPKLLLTIASTEMLLIAIDRKGLFHAIPYHKLPPPSRNINIQAPSFSLRLKLVRKYLGMMLCEHKFANIMAISGYEPNSFEESESEAARLKINGTGFPVRRNMKMEQFEAWAEKMRHEAMEQEKVITQDDPELTGRGSKIDSLLDSRKFIAAY